MQRCLGCMREFGEEFDVCPHCGYLVGTEAESKNHLAPGTVLQGRYTLGKVLGQGGFGITYIAWDQKLGRAVAIKEYMPNALASRMTGEKEISCYNEEAKRQFEQGLEKTRRESHALSQFGALESVVKVYDCIEENGTAYIIMELLRGRTVKEILKERGKLPYAETVRIMTPVLKTLDAMHAAGMIHRDVAPDNIFVCDDGKIKLLDFGAARVVNTAGEKSLSVMLKAGYAPIEQYSSKAEQGPYTDVYAACATMYKMLTGETPPDSMDRVVSDTLEPVSRFASVPAAAEKAIKSGMTVQAANRTRRVQPLLDALEPAKPAEKAADKTPAQPKSKPFLRKRAVQITAAVLAVAVAVSAVVAATRNRVKTTQNDDVTLSGTQNAAGINGTETDVAELQTEPLEQIEAASTEAATTTAASTTTTTTTKPATTTTTKPTTTKKKQLSVSVGDVITFGKYEQDNNSSNGQEAIEWIVLDKQDGRSLLVSKYALDSKPYNTKFTAVTWETCTLRKWLNGTFLNTAFSAEEQKRIPTVTVTADKAPNSDVDPGNDTRDKVFLLGYAEATQYFPTDAQRMCAPTPYAIAQGVWTSDDSFTSEGKAACFWRLRSAGYYSDGACNVHDDGWVGNHDIVNGTYCGIRPALWMNPES